MLDFFNAHINDIAIFCIFVIALPLALVGSFKDKGRLAKYAKQSPALLTTIGVFFSFCGILIALQHFDVDNKDSIKGLLEGLKIKFASSLMGIGASIIVKIAQSFKLEKDTKTVNSDQEIISLLGDIKQSLSEKNPNGQEQLLKELKESIAVLPQEFKKQSGLLENIKSSLAGDGDTSVTTQIMKMRMEIKDTLIESDKNNQKYLIEVQHSINKGFNALILDFRQFSEKMADNNSKALIEALENVMRDFNTKINEQFGDNFKQLNIAVGRLLEWQENYKNNVEITVATIQTIQASFADIQTRSESFASVSENLDKTLKQLDKDLDGLNKHLKAFDELADNAKNAFPIIQGNLTDLTTGFKNSTQKSLEDINNTVSDMRHKLDNVTTKLKDTSSQFENMAATIKQSVDTQEKSLSTAVNTQLDVISNSIGDANREFNRFLTENTTNTSKVLEQQVLKLDEALQNELIKSIKLMGEQLAGLSSHFVKDYTPLTQRLKDVVQIAEDLKRGRN